MIYICMADHRIEPSIKSIIQKFNLQDCWDSPSYWRMYPENDLSRTEIEDFVQRTIAIHKQNERNQVILTDSDFVVNEYRISIKEGRIQNQQIEIRVLENSSLSIYTLDQDGRWPFVPKIFHFLGRQLRRLL